MVKENLNRQELIEKIESIGMYIDDMLKRYYKICDMKQVAEIIKENVCEIDYDFLGFLYQYESLSKLIPKDWTIVDLGCSSGFQAEYFKTHKKYIGIIVDDRLKYQTSNAEYHTMRIKDFLESENFKDLDLSKTFAICNYVPCEIEVEMARIKFKNIFVYYPG